MKNKILLPHHWQLIGFMIFLVGFLGGLSFMIFNWEWEPLRVILPKWLPGIGSGLFNPATNNLTDEISLSMTLLGLCLICFSAEKVEDEFIRHNRLQSLQWALLINFVVLFVATWVVYNDGYWYVIITAMVTMPMIFLIRFRWMLYRNNL